MSHAVVEVATSITAFFMRLPQRMNGHVLSIDDPAFGLKIISAPVAASTLRSARFRHRHFVFHSLSDRVCRGVPIVKTKCAPPTPTPKKFELFSAVVRFEGGSCGIAGCPAHAIGCPGLPPKVWNEDCVFFLGLFRCRVPPAIHELAPSTLIVTSVDDAHARERPQCRRRSTLCRMARPTLAGEHVEPTACLSLKTAFEDRL